MSSSSSSAAAAGAAASAPEIRESSSIDQFESEIGQEQASFRSRASARFSDYQKRAAKSLGRSPFNGFESYPEQNWRHAEYIGDYMANKLVLLYNLDETKYRAIADQYESCGHEQHKELQKVTSYQEIDDWMQRNILTPLSSFLGRPKTDQGLASQKAALLTQDTFDIPDLSILSKRELELISPTPLASERDAINLRYQHPTAAAGGALGAAASAAAAAGGALGAAASADNPDAYRPAEGTASDRSSSELSRTIEKTRRSPSEAAAAALAAADASPAAQVQPTTWSQWLSGHARSAVSHLTGGGKERGK